MAMSVDNRTINESSDANRRPSVTGVRPNFGPYETSIDIRGSNLGFTRDDVKSVKICGVECIAQAKWISQSHIKCVNLVVTAEEVTGEIIVTTQSGGEGTSDGPQFTAHPPKDGSGLQSKYWEGDDKFVVRFGRTKETVVETPLTQKERDLLCLYDGLNMTERSSLNQLQKMLPHATKFSGDVKSEDFDPVFYILQNHANTKLEQLKQGQTLLNGLIDKQQKGPVEHLKKNMSQIVECNDIIQSLSRPIRDDETMSNKNLAAVCEKINKVNSETQQLFSGVLQRKDESDTMRNALNALSRFNFLFSLPKTIQSNLELARYDLILKDYEHGKVLMERNEDHVVFTTLENQIEQQILTVKQKLNSMILQAPQSLDFQVRMINYLIKLGLGEREDPALECINKMAQHIGILLNKCRETYSDYEHKRLKVEVHLTEPIRLVFIKEMCDLFKTNMALLLEMVHSYKHSGDKLNNSSSSSKAVIQYYTEENRPKCFVDKYDENIKNYDAVCLNLTKLFLNHVMKALTSDHELGECWLEDDYEGSNSHLMVYLNEIRSLVAFISQSKVSSGVVLKELSEQLVKIRIHCLDKLIRNANEELENYEEKWKFRVTDSGFESISLCEIVETMQSYLSQINQINDSYDDQFESSLWTCLSHNQESYFANLIVSFFTIIAEKYYTLATKEDLGDEDFIRQISNRSNIHTVSCFSALHEDMLFIIIMRNVAVLTAFVEGEFGQNSDPKNLPVELITQQCITRFSDIYIQVRDLFKEFCYQRFRQITMDCEALLPGSISNIHKASFSIQHTKVTKLGRLFLHHLVRVFGYVKTIHPTSVQSLFSICITQLVALIKKYSSNLSVSYTDIVLVIRLVPNHITSPDRKVLDAFLAKKKLAADSDVNKSEVEIQQFLDKNRFHFLCFSGS